MFKVQAGPETGTDAYLRPETAQGVYINFLQEFEVTRKKLPLGLAIIGKAFRNEISPRQLINRQREFTQAELQIFFDPEKAEEHPDWREAENDKLVVLPVKNKTAKEITCNELSKTVPKFFVYHMSKVQDFFLNVLQIPRDKFRMREIPKEKRAHYNKIHWDVELDLESLGGFREVAGIHYRTDYDLMGHQKVSNKKQQVFYNEKRITPQCWSFHLVLTE
mgnify:CR=1 FL=1